MYLQLSFLFGIQGDSTYDLMSNGRSGGVICTLETFDAGLLATNNIAEMDVIGNLTDQSEIFAEPFTELWKKILGTTAFMLNSIGCVIMLTFVGLERQGFGSYYRTALNQINSWILIFVSQLDYSTI